MPLIFGDNKMAVYSIVKLSELEGAKRIDAEYYKPIFNSLKTLYKFNVIKLNTISDIAYGTTPPGGIFEETGIPFVRSQNFTTGMINKAEIVFCKSEFHEQNKKSAIRPADILFAAVGGTIGQIAIVQDSIDEGNINQNIARVRILDSSINPYYAGLFFLSKYGQLQIFRFVTGNAQAYLNSFQIGSLKIPVLSKQIQNELASCFKKVEDFVENSHSLYSQAETLLLEELGLKDFKPRYEKTYTANLSDAFSAHRIDAEYFQPAYEEVEKYLIKNFSAKPIKKLSFIEVTTGQYSEKYVDESEGMPYIRGTDLKNGTINTDDLVYISPEDQIESKKAKEGDVVVTRVGTIGLSARVPKECEGGTISDNLIRLRFDQQKLNSYYLALFLGSPLGVNLMIKNSRGSVQQRLNQETLKEVIVPLLPLSTQQKIASLVQQSHEARKRAKELIEIAKRAVEIAIEKNEEEAKREVEEAIEEEIK